MPIQNILFDLGVVLLHIDYGPSLRCAAKKMDPVKRALGGTFFHLLERDPMIAKYEKGLVSAQEFFEHFCSKTGFQGDFDEFAELWVDIFSENTPMIEFARELADSYNIYLCSNASDLHLPAVYELFPSLDFIEDDAVSCYLGELKPDAAFYRKALEKFGIQPQTCLFIDDRPENVEGARRVGITSILYTNPGETIAHTRVQLS